MMSLFDASMRGITVELDGRPVAIAAVVCTRPMLAISAIGDALRKYPKTIAKTGKKFREILNLYDCAVYAVADEEEKNSPIPAVRRVRTIRGRYVQMAQVVSAGLGYVEPTG